MDKFKESGSKISRLSQEDMDAFRREAIPIWFRWAKKDPSAARILKLQIDYMKNDILGYLSEEDLKGFSV
ncbi:MAG: hypothetical protein KZQ64_06865 [gamma proteobacterium symbiont of Bathyaustriella thionipta]|nr:hypothetical protein [gamma proteobacterium symbiont of Bathyaustriella thionipta]MCU7953095.1 hypothetical protein [gamma proteobacterium symbiont of Bathyaustriella thionipta]MCU7955998.1 hypothetical protein [gamma proteobacterium symbiont of Bathyaustriella thionipta]MCU7968779.1 hypothetical protein [gamma proteobacterium symbiont of Bathyaustriella thionipta]